MQKSREITIQSIPWVIPAISLLVFAVFTYLYFLNASVVHVVMREGAVQEVSELHSRIATLETKLIAAQHTISARIANVDDYSDATQKIYLNREPASLVVRSE
jgi:hypothetical protein